MKNIIQYHRDELKSKLKLRHGGAKDSFEKMIDHIASLVNKKYIKSHPGKKDLNFIEK